MITAALARGITGVYEHESGGLPEAGGIGVEGKARAEVVERLAAGVLARPLDQRAPDAAAAAGSGHRDSLHPQAAVPGKTAQTGLGGQHLRQQVTARPATTVENFRREPGFESAFGIQQDRADDAICADRGKHDEGRVFHQLAQIRGPRPVVGLAEQGV